MKPFLLRDSIVIHAPLDRCFVLSTSVAVVEKELGMHPVDGRASGLVQAGDTIRWEGWQLGFPNYHVSRIENFNPPYRFRDRMIAGRFRSFEHDHTLQPTADGVFLYDELRFTMPFGWAGWLVGRLVLVPHIRGLMHRRFHLLKHLAESDDWRKYVPDDMEPSEAARHLNSAEVLE